MDVMRLGVIAEVVFDALGEASIVMHVTSNGDSLDIPDVDDPYGISVFGMEFTLEDEYVLPWGPSVVEVLVVAVHRGAQISTSTWEILVGDAVADWLSKNGLAATESSEMADNISFEEWKRLRNAREDAERKAGKSGLN